MWWIKITELRVIYRIAGLTKKERTQEKFIGKEQKDRKGNERDGRERGEREHTRDWKENSWKGKDPLHFWKMDTPLQDRTVSH